LGIIKDLRCGIMARRKKKDKNLGRRGGLLRRRYPLWEGEDRKVLCGGPEKKKVVKKKESI